MGEANRRGRLVDRVVQARAKYDAIQHYITAMSVPLSQGETISAEATGGVLTEIYRSGCSVLMPEGLSLYERQRVSVRINQQLKITRTNKFGRLQVITNNNSLRPRGI